MKLNQDGYPEVRAVTRADCKKFSELVKEFADKSGNKKLLDLSPLAKPAIAEEESDEATTKERQTDELYDVIKNVLESFFKWVHDDVTSWFMQLVECENLEEFDALPFDVDMYIIEQLLSQKGFEGFFLRAWGLYNRILG